MITGTLSRYFGLRFVSAVLAMFAGTLVLTAMIDFLELMRRSGDIPDTSAWLVAKITLFRVPFITERVLPFTVLVDGEPPGAAHGLDVDEDGHGTVSQQRLYQLIREPGSIADRTFEITFHGPGVEGYVFTFG